MPEQENEPNGFIENQVDPIDTSAKLEQPDPPIVEEQPEVIETPEPIIEEFPENTEESIPTDEAYDTEPIANPELYTVQAADLNAYPELSQQGVKLYDQVAYGSLYVYKNATAEGDSVVQDSWPRSTGNEKTKGLTFNGE